MVIERAAPPDPQPLHEAVADQRRVAHRLTDPGLVVDLRGNKDRPAFVEAPIHQLIEVRLVADPSTVFDSGAASDRHDVGVPAGRVTASIPYPICDRVAKTPENARISVADDAPARGQEA